MGWGPSGHFQTLCSVWARAKVGASPKEWYSHVAMLRPPLWHELVGDGGDHDETAASRVILWVSGVREEAMMDEGPIC